MRQKFGTFCFLIEHAHFAFWHPGHHKASVRAEQRRGADVKGLLVDDSVAIRQSFGALLATAPGVDVVGSAHDLATALAAIASKLPDLIVLDVKLLGPDRGIDVLHHVRRHHPDIKVIIFSQLNWAMMRKLHMEAGALAYFDKSTEFQQARDCVAELASAHDAIASAHKDRG
jgi:DNA-binding NarL/FixJ family response regulator